MEEKREVNLVKLNTPKKHKKNANEKGFISSIFKNNAVKQPTISASLIREEYSRIMKEM